MHLTECKEIWFLDRSSSVQHSEHWTSPPLKLDQDFQWDNHTPLTEVQRLWLTDCS